MIKRLSLSFMLVFFSHSLLAFSWFGEQFCTDPNYTCMTIKRGKTWTQLFPNPIERDIVKRVNRINLFLQMDMVIAVPKNLSTLTIFDVSPFENQIKPREEKIIYVDLNKLAWAAYNTDGQLMKWGPISPGTKTCIDDSNGCLTPTGSFRVIRKGGAECISKNFPKGIHGLKGGGEMPFCIFFHRGYALHGSSELPGYPASYGCVRLFVDDARWLNTEFVDLPTKRRKGTEVFVQN